MIDPDHELLVLADLAHQEAETKQALIPGVRVRTLVFSTHYQEREGTLLAYHPEREFPYEVDFGQGHTDAYAWYHLTVLDLVPSTESHVGRPTLAALRRRLGPIATHSCPVGHPRAVLLVSSDSDAVPTLDERGRRQYYCKDCAASANIFSVDQDDRALSVQSSSE